MGGADGDLAALPLHEVRASRGDPLELHVRRLLKPQTRVPDWLSLCSKFLIGRDGVPLRRYSPADPLEQGMEKDIVAALAGKPIPKRRSER